MTVTNDTSRIILRGLNFEDRRISTEEKGEAKGPKVFGQPKKRPISTTWPPFKQIVASFLRGWNIHQLKG